MKRKVIIVIYVILILTLIIFIYNYIVNNAFINNENYAKMLILGGIPQKYVANYNYGNILYKNAKYDDAIEEYQKALEGRVPKKQECSIRINYALAICKTVQVDESDSQSIKNTIKTYENAIAVLIERGCANENDDNGHSREAEQLKKDIQDEIERLKNLDKSDEDEKQDDQDKTNKDDKQESQTIEEKIQNIKENATQDQRQHESEFQDHGNDIYENRVERNW